MKWWMALAACAAGAWAADYQAGVARMKITPERPIWLSGYASRTHPSEGVLQDLWAKALVIQDDKGGRVALVTTDLIGLPRSLADLVAARVEKQYGLERSRLLLNSSHTHTGPALRGNLSVMWDLTPEQSAAIDEYSSKLADALVNVVGAALGDLKPARLAFGQGTAGFAANRRQPTSNGVVIGVNPDGPRDLSVPVLRVTSPDGKLLAVLFGYACHNTTLTGEHYKLSGDYAGYAQAAIENAHPSATALFLQLCAGDQNPNPRSTVELAEQHGRTLAGEVDRVLAGTLRPVRGPVRTAFRIVEPAFAPHTRETFEKQLTSTNPSEVRRAKLMLAAYDNGHPVRRVPYPVQAVRFGRDLTVVALGGEPVVDYALRIKREVGSSAEPVIVAGYSNDVMCYVPSVAVLKGGGYEPQDSMIYYGQPGPFSEDIEETVIGAVRSVLKRVGR
ncbi:MAG TPA: neutral/alkaline non-lysosomal ceramidase N-terminal domain-containing protein [Bryobacteraceae bacterium]|nr:neutral/alkaline non-lysosomal ceramidase N-terminal domain-containing protein [Bryobacteraceae bacterium]